MKVHCDLHIHSALSPCGEERMTPNNIVNMALVAGLELIALTDHNTCGNCRAAIEVGKRNGIAVIPGMELTTQEDAHVLCLFPHIDAAEEFERTVVRPRRMQIKNRPEIFGRQLIMNAGDEIIGEEEALLIPATDISAGQLQCLCRRLGGAAIPAHIDKQSNSLLASLGFIDAEMCFPVCEITPGCDENALRLAHAELADTVFIRDSDAHDLGPVGTNGFTLDLPGADAEGAVNYFFHLINGGGK